MNTGSIRLMFGVVAASSITWQPWTYDDTLGRWYEFVNPQTTTPTGAVTNVAVLNMLWVPGSKWFIQITANTLVQCMGYGWG